MNTIHASTPASDAPTGLLLVQRRDARPYEVGRTYRFGNVAGGGGDDGHYWTVVEAGIARETQMSDDTSEGERSAWAHVRPATEAEAASAAQHVAADAHRRDALRLINSNAHIVEFGCPEPSNSRPISEWQPSGLGHRERWIESGGVVYRVEHNTGGGGSPVYHRSSLTVEIVRDALDA